MLGATSAFGQGRPEWKAQRPSWYVGADGSDSNAGSFGSPFRTIARAGLAASRSAVKRIVVLPGVYAERVQPIEAGVSYVGVPGRTIVDGGGREIGFDIRTSRVSVSGFEVRNALYGVQIDGVFDCNIFSNYLHSSERGVFIRGGASKATVANCRVANTYDIAGINLDNCPDSLVQSCETSNCAGRGIYLRTGSSRSIVRDCYAHDCPAGSYGYEVEADSQDVQIIRCYAEAGKYGFISKSSARTRFDGCVAKDSATAGFYFKAGVNGFLYNSVAYACGFGVYLDDNIGGDPSTGNTLANNIFARISGNSINARNGSSAGLTSDFNSFAVAPSMLVDDKSQTFAQWRAAGRDGHSLQADPAFAEVAYGGFRLPAGSSLRKAGKYLGGTEPFPDLGIEGSRWDGQGYF